MKSSCKDNEDVSSDDDFIDPSSSVSSSRVPKVKEVEQGQSSNKVKVKAKPVDNAYNRSNKKRKKSPVSRQKVTATQPPRKQQKVDGPPSDLNPTVALTKIDLPAASSKLGPSKSNKSKIQTVNLDDEDTNSCQSSVGSDVVVVACIPAPLDQKTTAKLKISLEGTKPEASTFDKEKNSLLLEIDCDSNPEDKSENSSNPNRNTNKLEPVSESEPEEDEDDKPLKNKIWYCLSDFAKDEGISQEPPEEEGEEEEIRVESMIILVPQDLEVEDVQKDGQQEIPDSVTTAGSHTREQISSGSGTRRRRELHPCSIWCPGMTGEVPSLKCTHCLCLYHPECIGVPQNMLNDNYVCERCRGKREVPNVKDPGMVRQMMEPWRRSHINVDPTVWGKANLRGHGQNIAQTVGRSNYRPSGQGFPCGKNLTITPISIKGRPQPVPNLQPMNFIRKHSSSMGTRNPHIIDMPLKSSTLSSFRDRSTTDTTRPVPQRSMTESNFLAARQRPQASPTHVRRYLQSAVTVRSKKFVAVPNQVVGPGTTVSTFTGFGKNEFILSKMCPYLSVKDLLRASIVNTVWNKAATADDLWEVVRLKNARIYDVKAFGEFLRERNTETVDFRKMIFPEETNWDSIFEALGGVPSLRSVILSPDAITMQIVNILGTHCPNVTFGET